MTRRFRSLRVFGIPYIVTDMSAEMSGIANRVRGVLVEHSFTQVRVAAVLGIARSSVALRYQGRVSWSACELAVLANAMGIDAGDFFPKQTSKAVAA